MDPPRLVRRRESGGVTGRPGEVAGTGIVVLLAVTCAALLFLVLFYQSRLTSWMTCSVDSLVRGDLAEELADAYIQEALAGLRRGVDAPGTELFSVFRRPVSDAEDDSEYDLLGLLPCPRSDVIARRRIYADCELVSRRASIVFRRALDRTAYEYRGLVRLSATVRNRSGLSSSTVTRRVEYVQPFQVVLTSMPRPFCSFGIFVGDAATVTDAGRANLYRRKLLDSLSDLWSKAARLGVDDGLDASVARSDATSGAITLPVGPTAFYGLATEGMRQDLSGLDLAELLSDRLSRARAVLSTAPSSIPGNAGSRDALRSVFRGAGELLTDGLWHVWAFTRAYRMLPEGDPGYAAIEAAGAVFEPSYWHRRATHSIGASELDGFRSRYPCYQGILLIRNEASPVLLSGTWRGRFVLVFGQGGVKIRDFNIGDSEEDRVVVVSLGGPVDVDGEVHAALVLADGPTGPVPSLEIGASARLSGAICARRLPDRGSLGGILERKEKYSSGLVSENGTRILAPDHLCVYIPPSCAYRKVERR